MTLKDNTMSYCLLCLYVADPANFLDSNSVPGNWQQLVYSLMGKNIYLINIVNITILSLDVLSKTT